MESKQHSTGSAARPGRAAACIVRSAAIALTACASAGAFAPARAATAAAPAAKVPAAATPPQTYYEKLRAQMHWMPIRVAGRAALTPDPKSRVLLARSAAERAGLAEVGLDFRDVYGVINAETSWLPRDGLGRNGVTSEGLAQFEPATARALGVRNANDPVEAVHAAATLLKEAAQWSARRIAGLRLAGAERSARLREGISVYYNLSTTARQRWDGRSDALPVETQRHIRNVRAGAQQAERIAAGAGIAVPTVVASAAPAAPSRVAAKKPAAPHPVGTIEWSRSGQRAVVWSDGTMTREAGGRVRWTSNAPPSNRKG